MSGILVVVAIAAGLGVLALGSAELLLRAKAGKYLRDWGSWEMEHKAAAVDRLADRGGASVVAIGPSHIQAAVEPQLLTELLGWPRPAFNAALNGATPRTLELWTMQIVLPRLRPDVVVLGVNSSEFADNSLVGQRILDRFRSSVAWRALTGDTGTSFRERALFRLERRSYVFRCRRFLRGSTRAKVMHQKQAERVSDLGFLEMVRTLLSGDYQIRQRQLNIWGEVVVDYDAGGHEAEAFGRLVDRLRAAGVAVVIARMPVTADWDSLHPHGEADLELFEQVLAAFLRTHDVPYVDLRPRFTKADHCDPVHLNTRGMERFTAMVADLVAPYAPRSDGDDTPERVVEGAASKRERDAAGPG